MIFHPSWYHLEQHKNEEIYNSLILVQIIYLAQTNINILKKIIILKYTGYITIYYVN